MRSMRFKIAAVVMFAGLVSWCDADELWVLETAGTEMVFRKTGSIWLLDHYGAKGVSAEDSTTLAYQPGLMRDSSGLRKNATLSVFGDRTFDSNPNRYGGLAVTHADGVVSTELSDVGSSFLDEKDGAKHIVLRMKDVAYDFLVDQHFRARPACDVIETWLELRNGETGAVRLMRMDSVALTFPLGEFGKTYLMTLSGDWGWKAVFPWRKSRKARP